MRSSEDTNVKRTPKSDGFCETLCVLVIAQLTFTCSNSSIKTLEKGVKYVQNQY